jgi:hypothetical protein
MAWSDPAEREDATYPGGQSSEAGKLTALSLAALGLISRDIGISGR